MAGDQLTGGSGGVARAVVDQYMSVLAGRLDAPTSHLSDIRDEVEDGLSEAIESYRRQGLPPDEAARAAVAEFGEPTATAAAFAPELRLARAHRTGLGLVLTGPLVGLLWIATVVVTGLPSGWAGLSGPWLVPLLLIALAVAVGAGASELAVAASGRLSLRLAARPGVAPAAAMVARVAALVTDGTILAAGAVLVLLGPGGIPPVPAVLAVAASVLRMAFVGRDLVQSLFRIQVD